MTNTACYRTIAASVFIGYAALWNERLYEVGDTAITDHAYITHGDGLRWAVLPSTWELVVSLAVLCCCYFGLCVLGLAMLQIPRFHRLLAISVCLFLSAFGIVLRINFPSWEVSSLMSHFASDFVPCRGLDIAMVPLVIGANAASLGAANRDARTAERMEYHGGQPRSPGSLGVAWFRSAGLRLYGVLPAVNTGLLMVMGAIGSGWVPVSERIGSLNLENVFALLSCFVSCLLLIPPIVSAVRFWHTRESVAFEKRFPCALSKPSAECMAREATAEGQTSLRRAVSAAAIVAYALLLMLPLCEIPSMQEDGSHLYFLFEPKQHAVRNHYQSPHSWCFAIAFAFQIAAAVFASRHRLLQAISGCFFLVCVVLSLARVLPFVQLSELMLGPGFLLALVPVIVSAGALTTGGAPSRSPSSFPEVAPWPKHPFWVLCGLSLAVGAFADGWVSLSAPICVLAGVAVLLVAKRVAPGRRREMRTAFWTVLGLALAYFLVSGLVGVLGRPSVGT